MSKRKVSPQYKNVLVNFRMNTTPDAAFDKVQLRKGVAVEMEHTDDPVIAKSISKDHLLENDLYYVGLEAMERQLESEEKKVKRK
jgi:hypothetical protein